MNLNNEKGGVFVVNDHIYSVMKRAMKDESNIWNILLLGPSGCGKTTLPMLLGKELGLDVLKMDCGTVRDPEEWFGKRGAANGATYFEPSPLVQAIKKGGVIILDELNRVQPYILSTLYGVLDDTRQVLIHNELVKVSPKTTIIATINEGVKYSGTFRLDEALRQRFDIFIGVDYPENEIDVYSSVVSLEEAQIILDVLQILRVWDEKQRGGGAGELDVSTRTGVKVAKLMRAFKLSIADAFDLSLLSSIQDRITRKNVIDTINSAMSGVLKLT
jgi:MoxR-like ATPase